MCRWLQRSFIHFLLLCFHLSTCFYLIKLKQILVGFVMLTSIFLFFCYFAFFFSVRVSAFFSNARLFPYFYVSSSKQQSLLFLCFLFAPPVRAYFISRQLFLCFLLIVTSRRQGDSTLSYYSFFIRAAHKHNARDTNNFFKEKFFSLAD